MSAHLTKEQLEAYCERRLSARELLSVSDHLEKCGQCRIETERELQSDALFFDLQSTALEAETAAIQPAGHLTMEETAAYVDGLLSEDNQQAARDHLSGCELCALAVEDLTGFSKQVAPQLTREYHPVRVPTSERSEARIASFHVARTSLCGSARGSSPGCCRVVDLGCIAETY